MRYLKIGSLRVSVIGVGAWQIGTRSWGWGSEFGSRTVGQILDEAHERGINLIDTAELYGDGESERQIGSLLRYDSEDFVLASKVSPWHLTATGVYNAAVASLQRLRRLHIDLYQIHAPNPFIPLSRTMVGMNRLITEGKIKQVGVSNFSLSRWRRAEKSLGAPIITNQVYYNLLHPTAFQSLKPMLDDGRVMVAYSPLGMGLLTGKYGSGRKPGVSQSRDASFNRRNRKNVGRILEALETIAKRHDATIGQIALAWVISHPNVIAIPGAKSAEQVRENAMAADIQLSYSEITELDTLSCNYRAALHVPSPFELFRWVTSW